MNNISHDNKKFNPAEHLISLKGKDYLQVQWRVVWLRDENPTWTIDTHAIHVDENSAFFVAKIYDGEKLIASGHGSEQPKDFPDYIEKAETKAVGRALAYAGYGTQFTADELDEGSRIVDSPVQRKKAEKKEEPKEKTEPLPKGIEDAIMFVCEKCGNVLTPHKGEKGNEYGVRQISEITKKKYGMTLCWDCACAEGEKRKAANKDG